MPDESSLVSRDCPVCGAHRASIYLQKGELRLVRCDDCGTIFANPVPAEYGTGEYYDRIGSDYYLNSQKLESDYAAVRFERERRLFRRYFKTGSVLDVGCSSGGFLYQLGQRFPGDYRLLGTDVSGPALDYAEAKGLAVVRGDFLNQSFSGKHFGAVTFWAVLEHLLNPKSFLEKAWTILEPRGLCFVLVPNMASLAVRLLHGRYRYIYPPHLNYFARETLEKLASDRFSILECRSMHFNPLVLWQDWRDGGVPVSNQARAQLLKRTTAFKQNPFLKPAKAIYHLAEAILGRLTLADNIAFVLQKP
jgi:SAM-dependent methyltransferase